MTRKAVITVGAYTVKEMPTGSWWIFPTEGEELDLTKHNPVGFFGKKDDAIEAAKTLRRNQ